MVIFLMSTYTTCFCFGEGFSLGFRCFWSLCGWSRRDRIHLSYCVSCAIKTRGVSLTALQNSGERNVIYTIQLVHTSLQSTRLLARWPRAFCVYFTLNVLASARGLFRCLAKYWIAEIDSVDMTLTRWMSGHIIRAAL